MNRIYQESLYSFKASPDDLINDLRGDSDFYAYVLGQLTTLVFSEITRIVGLEMPNGIIEVLIDGDTTIGDLTDIVYTGKWVVVRDKSGAEVFRFMAPAPATDDEIDPVVLEYCQGIGVDVWASGIGWAREE